MTFEVNRQFQMPGCKYFEMITITDHPTPNPWKLWLKLKARKITYYFRAGNTANCRQGRKS